MRAVAGEHRISVVIVNSDGRTDTLACLRSIYRHPPTGSFEVILVDNVSTEEIFPAVAAAYPDVALIRAPRRQGFSKNYNLGIRAALGGSILILNNDTIVEEHAIDRLLEFVECRREYGMAGPLLVSGSGALQPVSARRSVTFTDYILEQVLLDLALPLGKLRHRLHGLALGRRPSGDVECISGACMLVTREALAAAGDLDERYDFYFEDIEWCRRIWSAGFRVGFVPEARVIHHGDRSLSKVRFWAKQSELKGALLYFTEHDGIGRTRIGILRTAVLFGYLLRALSFSIFGRFLNGQNQARTYWRLFAWLRGTNIQQIQRELKESAA